MKTPRLRKGERCQIGVVTRIADGWGRIGEGALPLLVGLKQRKLVEQLTNRGVEVVALGSLRRC